MKQAEKLAKQFAALTAASNQLVKDYPDDMDSFRELNTLIDDVQLRLDAAITHPEDDIGDMPPDQVTDLTNAIATLEQAVKASQGADAILQAATALAAL